MSLTSWARLVREVLRVEAGASTVAPAVVARQTTSSAVAVSATTSYGMGWFITTGSWANGKVLYHDGINTANHSLAVIAPARNVAFLATTNGFDPGGRSWKALNALIGRLDDLPHHRTLTPQPEVALRRAPLLSRARRRADRRLRWRRTVGTDAAGPP